MSDDTLTVELSVRQVRALRNMATLLCGAFEDIGCDLTDVDLPEGDEHAVSPLLTAAIQLEMALALAGVDVS